jgi:hypothetical protein
VQVRDDGTLTAAGRVVGGPLLADTFGSTVRLRGAWMLEAGPTAALWVPDRSGTPRLSLYALGRYHDGWLADTGAIYVWPEVAGGPLSGWLTMRLSAPRNAGAVRLTFGLPEDRRVSVRVRPGKPQRVSIAVCGTGSRYVTYRSNVHGYVGLRAVSVRATAPVFSADASACPVPQPVS